MAERTFVDTNVLIYAHDRSDERKQGIAADILARLWGDRSGTLSTQVLQEFYAVTTRRWEPKLPRPIARQLVAAYGQWHLVQVDAPLILAATDLEERHTLSFWDSLILEAARRAGASLLLSEDFQHGRTIGGVRIENPFV